MRLIYSIICLLISPVLAVHPVWGQQNREPRALEHILTVLQQQTGYRFNYSPDIIKNITCTLPKEGAQIGEIIQHLEQETGLGYNILPNDFISIKPKVQKICGYLKDGVFGEPVRYATVWTETASAISDETGFFELEVEHLQPVNFRHIGYYARQLTLVPESNNCQEVILDINQQILPEIVLSDYLITGIDKLNDGSYNLDFEDFTILPGLTDADVLQSVQAFPGIISVNETVSNINIRGGSHDQNLILWDDIKMYQSGHFFGLISMYNPQITQSVSLRKNGTTAAATDGVSGTIDMKTAPEVSNQLTGNLGINFIDANAFLDIPVGEKSSVQVSARKALSELLKTPTYAQYFDRISQDTEVESDSTNGINSDINFDFFDGSLRWIYKPTARDEIRVNALYAINELIFNENAVRDSQQVAKESSLNQISIAGGISYQRTWSDRHISTIGFYESDYRLKSINANIAGNQRLLQENEVSESGIRLTSDYKINDWFQWNNGYQFTETKVTNLNDVDFPVYRKLIAEVVRSHALFSELGYVFRNGKSNMNLGGRINYLEKFDKYIFEPRLSFNHQISDWWNIEILAEFKHQYTSQIINFQNDFLGIENRRWQLSDNDTIPIITSKQISLGTSHARNGWLFDAVAFYKSVVGISSQSQGFQNQYEFIKSSGSYSSAGIDLLIRKQINRINSWLCYSFLDSQYTFEEFEVTSFPSNFDITHSISLGTTYAKYPFMLSAGINWHTGKPTTRPKSEPMTDQIEYESPNSDRLEDYMRVDLSAIYQFNLGESSSAEFGFSIWNLLDRDNPINNFYRIDASGKATEVVQNSLGLTPNILFRVYLHSGFQP